MTLHAFDTTVNRIPGTDITVTVPIYSTEPGTVTATASGCTFPDGETVVIAGTREYRLDGRGGDYLAISGVCASRDDVTWLFEIDFTRITQNPGNAASVNPIKPIVANWKNNDIGRANWLISAGNYYNNSYTIVSYATSQTSATNAVAILSKTTSDPGAARQKWAMTKTAAGVTNLYRIARANVSTITYATTGTMGGTEVLVLYSGIQFARLSRVIDNAELDAWFSAGTVPTTNREVVYLGGHEIVPGAEKIWDSAGTNDLYAYQPTNWPAPGMTIRNVDSVTVIPASSIRVTIPAGVASPVTLTLTRPRQGVPSRATDGEKYETASGVITLVDPATRIKVGPRQIYGVYL